MHRAGPESTHAMSDSTPMRTGGLSCGTDAATGKEASLSIQLTTTPGSAQTSTKAPAAETSTSDSSESPPAQVGCAARLLAALGANVPRSILFAVFTLMLSLFIVSVTSSYKQTQSAADVAVAYDDFTSSLYFTSTDDPRWTMYSIKYKQFGLAIDLNDTVDASVHVPPFISDGYNPYLFNLCRGAPTWKCDFTKFAGGGLLAREYAKSNGYETLEDDPPSKNYIRLELTWNSLTPSITGGSVTLNYHIVLPEYLKDTSQFPTTSLFQLKFLLTAKNVIIVAQGSSAFDGRVTLELPSGSWNMYPFDTYKRLLTPACEVADPGARFGPWSIANPASRNIAALTGIAMSFILKIDLADLGVFSHSESFVPATETHPEFEKNGLPQLTATFSRPTVNRLYPMFLVVAFWLILICEITIYFPYVGHTKKFDNFALVAVSVALMFALPSIRNTMPAAPPFGAVIDFASFFWAILVAILCFVFATTRYARDTWPAAPAPPAVVAK